jgi:hypothetical protein
MPKNSRHNPNTTLIVGGSHGEAMDSPDGRWIPWVCDSSPLLRRGSGRGIDFNDDGEADEGDP